MARMLKKILLFVKISFYRVLAPAEHVYCLVGQTGLVLLRIFDNKFWVHLV